MQRLQRGSLLSANFTNPDLNLLSPNLILSDTCAMRALALLGAVGDGVQGEKNESIHCKIGSDLLFHRKFAN